MINLSAGEYCRFCKKSHHKQIVGSMNGFGQTASIFAIHG